MSLLWQTDESTGKSSAHSWHVCNNRRMRRLERCRRVYTAEITGEKITVEARAWVEAIDNDKSSLGDWQWRESKFFYCHVHKSEAVTDRNSDLSHWAAPLVRRFQNSLFLHYTNWIFNQQHNYSGCFKCLRFWSIKAVVWLQLSVNSLDVVAGVLWRAVAPIHMPDVWLWIITHRNEWEEIFILPHSIYTEDLFHFIIWGQVNPVQALLLICKALRFHHSRS